MIIKNNILKESNFKVLSEKLEKMELTIYSDVTSKGRLFGSITPKEISKHLQNQNINIDYKKISLVNPIKSIGSHKVKIDLTSDIKSTLKISVVN
jgi:large subunit ribosomal protein L9